MDVVDARQLLRPVAPRLVDRLHDRQRAAHGVDLLRREGREAEALLRMDLDARGMVDDPELRAIEVGDFAELLRELEAVLAAGGRELIRSDAHQLVVVGRDVHPLLHREAEGSGAEDVAHEAVARAVP